VHKSSILIEVSPNPENSISQKLTFFKVFRNKLHYRLLRESRRRV